MRKLRSAFPALASVLWFALGAPTLGGAAGMDARRFEAIAAEHFQTYARWLDLDEPQHEIARILFEEYWTTYREEVMPLIRAYNSMMPTTGDPDYADAFDRFTPERHDLIALIEENEERFLDRLESVLRDEQLPTMKRVRFARQRHVWRTGRSELPEGNVHLADLVMQLDLSDEEQQRVFEILDTHEPQFIYRLKNSRRMLVEFFPLQGERLRIQKELTEDLVLPPDERMSEQRRAGLERRRWDLYEETADLLDEPGEALLRVNRDGFRAIRSALDESSAAEFRRLYLEASYPEVYPDPVNADALYRAALELDDVTEEQRDHIKHLHEQFLREYERASKALADVFLERDRAARSGGPEKEVEAFSLEEILKTGLAREAVNEKQLVLIGQVLTPEQMERLPDTWDFEKNPPARPWDWGNRIRRREMIEERHRRDREDIDD